MHARRNAIAMHMENEIYDECDECDECDEYDGFGGEDTSDEAKYIERHYTLRSETYDMGFLS